MNILNKNDFDKLFLLDLKKDLISFEILVKMIFYFKANLKFKLYYQKKMKDWYILKMMKNQNMIYLNQPHF